jgi:hypothetical protein
MEANSIGICPIMLYSEFEQGNSKHCVELSVQFSTIFIDNSSIIFADNGDYSLMDTCLLTGFKYIPILLSNTIAHDRLMGLPKTALKRAEVMAKEYIKSQNGK